MRRLALLAMGLVACSPDAGDEGDEGSATGAAGVVELALRQHDCVGKTSFFGGRFAPVAATVTLRGGEKELVLDVDPARPPFLLTGLPVAGGLTLEVRFFADEARTVQLGYGVSPPFRTELAGAVAVTAFVYPVKDAVRALAADGTCAQMAGGRAGASVARLNDGRVLVAGGYSAGGGWESPGGMLDTAEIFDLATGELTRAARMCPDAVCSPRAYGPAVTLPDGRVLIAGGMTLDGQDPGSAHALIYDPSADRWTQVPMNQARRYNTATQLPRAINKVLVVGGVGDPAAGGAILATTEIFDARTSTFEQGATLPQPIARHGAAYFTSKSTVGIAGGITTNQAGGVQISDALIAFDPGTGHILTSASVQTPVVGATVTQLGNLLLVFGGTTEWTPRVDAFAEGKFPPGSTHAGWQTWDGGAHPTSHDDSGAGLVLGCGVAVGARAWLGGGVNASLSTLDTMRLAAITGSSPQVGPVWKPLQIDVDQSLEDNSAEAGCVALDDRRVIVLGGWGNRSGGADHALDTIEIVTLDER